MARKTSFDRAFDRLQSLQTEARRIFREARVQQQTHGWLLDNLSVHVWSKRVGLPGWASNNLDGYVQALFHDNEDMIRHCYVMHDGRIIELSDYRNFTPEQVANEHVASGTFWKNTFKPYFVQLKDGQGFWNPPCEK